METVEPGAGSAWAQPLPTSLLKPPDIFILTPTRWGGGSLGSGPHIDGPEAGLISISFLLPTLNKRQRQNARVTLQRKGLPLGLHGSFHPEAQRLSRKVSEVS